MTRKTSATDLYDFFMGPEKLVALPEDAGRKDDPTTTSFDDILSRSGAAARGSAVLPSEDPVDYIFAIGEAGGNLEGLGTLVTMVERSHFMEHGRVHDQHLESRIYRNLPVGMEEIEPSLFACAMPLRALMDDLERRGFEHSEDLQQFVFRIPGREKDDGPVGGFGR